MSITQIQQHLPGFGAELTEAMASHGQLMEVPANTELVREGQYIKVIPIVLKGAIKVFARFEEKELLLYYIEPKESCVMSFSASLKNEPSRIVAVTEEDSLLLLLPSDKINKWIKEYPHINQLFYQQYNQRYSELLDTINHLLFNRLDQRVYNYLLERSKLKGEKTLQIKHRQIAAELGTVREVVTRVLKRLEQEGKLAQTEDGIEILQGW